MQVCVVPMSTQMEPTLIVRHTRMTAHVLSFVPIDFFIWVILSESPQFIARAALWYGRHLLASLLASIAVKPIVVRRLTGERAA